jgi:ribose 5-phosphate isomerase A
MFTSDLKRMAARHAVELVEPGMVVGLGTGSTVMFVVQRIGQLVRNGELHDVLGVPTSVRAERLACHAGVPLTSLDEHPQVDLTIDGADEVDPRLDLIKGLGGALLREKLVAQASRQEIIVVDASKLVQRLGEHVPLPVEVIPFAWRTQMPFLESLGADPILRLDPAGQPFITDEGNFIIDCHFGPLADPYALASVLHARPGIVEHGLFLGIASDVVVASSEGIQRLCRTRVS